ncbi:triose-phosphate isomerase [Paramagnetospirillum kuznetsovii]|uniref:Triosephosphate isomerase n=1 Tax=Paramagnetospirillum kuznetsovii TaxID=2053833 RepID=A0A364NZE6_9PROT|nr:triose-phosphate isomerase [Paramagnetospirillum kuznetsovii]RAU22413.1 triose-phosphate isomerase [Paramagnetospirillum kuznetsovii]
MTTRRKLIAGNWKMNGLKADGLALARGIVDKLKTAPAPACDLLVCPPTSLVALVAEAVGGSALAVGGQDCHAKASGAHTGDTAAVALADLGCAYVIVGHSERRTDHAETDAVVKAKAEAALAAGMIAIVCIGETLAQRDAGQTIEINRSQLRGSLPEGSNATNTVIAYEPVWAIGTGRVATPAQAQEVHAAIRAELVQKLGADTAGRMRILYGGSMKPDNAKELLALPDVDGGLIGGAALKVADFWAIAESC